MTDPDQPSDGLVWSTDEGEADSLADELEIGRERAPRSRRAKLLLGGVGVLAAAVVVTVAVAQARPDASTPLAHRSTTVSTPAPTPTATPFTFAPPEPDTGPRVVFDVPGRTCDVISGSGLSCSINDRVPATVLAALRSVLPGARVLPGSITVTGPGLRVQSRHVKAGAAGGSVAIDVLSTGERLPPTRPSGPVVPGGRRLQIVVDDGDHAVTVTAVGTSDHPPDRAELTRLAKDPRLLTVEP